MNGSLHIARIAGIDFKIHISFPLIIIWFGVSGYLSGGGMSAAITNVLLILALFLFVILHEFGHALTAKLFGIATRDITLLPFGGIAHLERMPEDPKEEFLVSIAGPAVNAAIAAGLFTGLLLSGFFNQPLVLTELLNNIWIQMMVTNVSLALFNLIPAFPMDGGRVLRSILALFIDELKATQIAANIGKALALVMGIAGFFFNPWLILIAVFIWFGASTEAQRVETKIGLRGLVVRDALVTKFHQVEANQPLSDVIQLAIATDQRYIPVVSNDNFLGIIRRFNLIKAIDRLGGRAPAYAAIDVDPEGLDPETPLEEVLPKFATHPVLTVLDGRQLVGLLTPDSVQQLLLHNQHLGDGKIKHQSTGESTDVV